MEPHTRINFTPTGQHVDRCLTLGNIHAAKVNWHMAIVGGGTFTIQQEDLLAFYMSITYRDRKQRRLMAEAAIKQLGHYGIAPSPPKDLEAADVPLGCAIQWESDYKATVDIIWRHLLPYRARMPQRWREWPPHWVEGASNSAAVINMGRNLDSESHYRGVPVYITAGRVIRDMIAGRNTFANGEECQQYKAEYNTICTMLGIDSPVQLTIPLLRHKDSTGKISKVAVSEGPGNLYWVGELINEGMTYDQLWSYLQPIVFQGGIAAWGGITPRQKDLDLHLHPYPVIDDADWIAYRADCAAIATEKQKKCEVFSGFLQGLPKGS